MFVFAIEVHVIFLHEWRMTHLGRIKIKLENSMDLFCRWTHSLF